MTQISTTTNEMIKAVEEINVKLEEDKSFFQLSYVHTGFTDSIELNGIEIWNDQNDGLTPDVYLENGTINAKQTIINAIQVLQNKLNKSLRIMVTNNVER